MYRYICTLSLFNSLSISSSLLSNRRSAVASWSSPGADVLADVSAVGDPPASVVGAPEPVAPAQGGGPLGAGQGIPIGHGRAVS